MYGAIGDENARPDVPKTRSRLRRVAGTSLAAAAFVLSVAFLNARDTPEGLQLSATEYERAIIEPIVVNADAFSCLDADKCVQSRTRSEAKCLVQPALSQGSRP